MGVVDDRGRLFGRFNLIDAVVGIFAVGLIPLLYGAAALFWAPAPVLTAIAPATLPIAPEMRVRIQGEHLKPYLRVSFGEYQGRDFLFRSTTEAEITLNPMPAGVYDVILYDVAQERSRLPKALTIAPAPIPPSRVTLVGVLGNLDAARAKRLTVGTTITGLGMIGKIGEPMPASVRVSASQLTVDIPLTQGVMLPVEIETGCDVQTAAGIPHCYINNLPLQPTVLLYGEHDGNKLPFQIDQIRGPEPIEPVVVSVRVSADPQAINGLREGDVDLGPFTNPLAAGARVTAVTRRGSSADVTLSVSAQRGADGWLYGSAPLRVGRPLPLRSARYELQGTGLTITPEWTPPR
jgi:hypothetical protein